MSSQSENNKRIAKNTLLLYSRMIFTMLVSLFTSRVILNTLGVEDYGIYNVVGGLVMMFSIISGSLSSAVCRFITFELGKKNYDRLKSIFSTAVNIQIVIAFLVFLVSEILGVWFLNTKMIIPSERIYAANWVLQCSIVTFMINLISVPYTAAIIAHERMNTFAYVSILEVSLKLVFVYCLYVSMLDKLITMALLFMLLAIIIQIVYVLYCKRQFEECSYHFVYDKNIVREMTGFAGWNFIGASSAVLRDQGVNIAINLFCGPVVNAARGIAMQVNGAVVGFVNNFMTALNPQITKSYANGDFGYMMKLIYQGARLSFYLLLFLSLPIIIEADTVLEVWLKVVPEYTVNFVRLVLIFAMAESISYPLVTAMLATGKIRNYQIVVGGLQLLNFPVSYFLLYLGVFPEITMIVAIVISQFCLMARLYMLRKMIGLYVRDYIKRVYFNIISVSVLSFIVPFIVYVQMPQSLLRFFLICMLCILITPIVLYFVGCNKKERIFVNNLLVKTITKMKQ